MTGKISETECSSDDASPDTSPVETSGFTDQLRQGSSVNPLVSVRDLHVSFSRGGERISALRGVSFDIGPGEILGLVGQSGSGKSVLGLTMLGLLPTRPRPTISGVVNVCGTDMVTASPEAARQLRRVHLGAVFQDPMTSLNPTMRIGQQVIEAAGSSNEAIRLLDAVGVPDPARRLRSYPHELSGGLRQRVMIAMALAGSPALVVADEPTTALDVTVQGQILELLSTLRDEFGTSFVLVTHDLGVAAQIADRIAVLYGGRLAEIGPARNLFQAPRHPYSRGLLRSRLVLTTDRTRPVMTLPGQPPDPRRHPPGCPFGPRCAFHSAMCDDRLPELDHVTAVDSSITSQDSHHKVACVRLSDVTGDAEALGLTLRDSETTPWSPVVSGREAPILAVLLHEATKQFSVGRGRHQRQLQALRGVNLTLNGGQAVALVGESGCGKSTLLRAIGGLHRIDGGQLNFGRGARPQMVFQDAGASLTPWLSVGEQIGERLRLETMKKSERTARVLETLSMVGLPPEVAVARPAQLSGGQRQRVALARAIVVPPAVLLCDEPTSALDVSLAATVLNLITRLRRELGMAVLFVTHDLAAARMVGDKIAVMYLGRIIEVGEAEDLCTDPIHPYTKALLATVPGAGHVRVALRGEPANPLDPPSGCPFHPRCPSAIDSCATNEVHLEPVDSRPDRSVACPVMLSSRVPHEGTSTEVHRVDY